MEFWTTTGSWLVMWHCGLTLSAIGHRYLRVARTHGVCTRDQILLYCSSERTSHSAKRRRGNFGLHCVPSVTSVPWPGPGAPRKAEHGYARGIQEALGRVAAFALAEATAAPPDAGGVATAAVSATSGTAIDGAAALAPSRRTPRTRTQGGTP